MAAKSHRALKITGIVIGVIVGIALIAVVALNIYMRVAFAPFFDRAESPFDIPGINTGFVPQDLDHVEADDSWLFSGYMADHSPSPLYRRAADGTITKFYVSLPDGSPYDGHGSAITTNEQYAYLACEEGYLVIPMDDLLFAEDGASVQATEKVDVDLSPAFMNIEQGQLLLGNFYYPNDYETPENHHITTPDGTENPAVMYAFAADPAEPGRFLTVPDGTFTTGSGDEVELFCLDSRNLTEDLVGPPMQEGIESHDGRVYTTDESASNKYIFGKLCGAGRVYAVQL